MSNELDLPALRKEVLQIADNKMHQVAKMVTNDLKNLRVTTSANW